MNKKLFKLVLAFVALLVIVRFSLPLFAGDEKPDRGKLIAGLISETLSRYHYSPLKLDDRFSERAFSLFLKSLDSNKRFLTKADVAQLEKYRNSIDDDLKNNSTELFDLSNTLMQKRIRQAQGFSREILAKPFNLTKNESVETDPEKRKYCSSEKELKELWRLTLKYQTLERYMTLLEKEKSSKKAAKFLPALEKQAREEVSKDINRTLTRMLEEKPEARFNRYLNAIAGCFDPHTEYFPPADKENFDISMSGTLEGIGAMLSEDGEYIKVMEIVPGSAAWRQKGLQVEDYILKVAQGDGEPVDVVNMPVNDVVKLIRGKKGTEVKLTVKKPSGQIVVIPIIRDVVVVEESYAKSVVITDTASKKKFGYIYLPSFYHDFKSEAAHSSSADVKAEIEELNQENISGLILDLRNNGGGFLDDAVKISGLFIKDGPVVQEKDSENRRQVKSDNDSSISYKGPMVVLINSLSASASEILAAALQDYGRAVIIGSPSSFGKGTVQTFADLDTLVTANNLDAFKPLGSLKLTIQKFYRINGGSTQEKGVASDIVLPDSYSYLKIGEKGLDYLLPWDTVPPAKYQKWSEQPNLTLLKAKSAQRVKNSKSFKQINEYIAQVQALRDKTNRSLELSKFRKDQDLIEKETKKLEDVNGQLPNIKVSATSVDRKNSPELVSSTKMKDWYKQVNKDAYINEALSVLKDMMGQK